MNKNYFPPTLVLIRLEPAEVLLSASVEALYDNKLYFSEFFSSNS